MKEDIKYPYIGEFKTTNTTTNILFYKEGFGINFDDKELKGTDLYIESSFKNITREHLANTYGKVESKEHAEFIVELCIIGNIKTKPYTVNGARFFMVVGDELYFYSSIDIPLRNNCKQITIPLPPKEVEVVEEWPKVNDEAVLVSMGMTTYNKLVRLTYIGDGVGCYIDLTKGIEYTYAKRETVFKKPKTPEEELQDELIDIIDNASCSEQAAEYIVKTYLTLNTKKPQ